MYFYLIGLYFAVPIVVAFVCKVNHIKRINTYFFIVPYGILALLYLFYNEKIIDLQYVEYAFYLVVPVVLLMQYLANKFAYRY
jgi:hypothetical protein